MKAAEPAMIDDSDPGHRHTVTIDRADFAALVMVGPLSQGGLIERFSGQMALTDQGRGLARRPNVGLTLEEYHRALLDVVGKKSGASRRLLERIIALKGSSISAEDLGNAAGIDSTGGYFSNSIGPLSTLGLIERRAGVVTPTHVLFPEGLA